jgi:hypothetical protein
MCDGQCLQKDKPLTSHATPGWKYDRERQRAIIVMQTGRGCVRRTVKTETAPSQETRQGRREGSGFAKERRRHAKESRAEGEQQCDGQLPSVELESVVGLGGCGKAQRICQMEIQSPLARRIPPQRLNRQATDKAALRQYNKNV